jgi:hypothetical protein
VQLEQCDSSIQQFGIFLSLYHMMACGSTCTSERKFVKGNLRSFFLEQQNGKAA